MKFEVKYGWNVKSAITIILTLFWCINILAIISGIKWFTPIMIFTTILAILCTGKRVIVTECYMIYISPLLIRRRYLFKNIEKVVISTEYTDRYEIDRVGIYHIRGGKIFTLTMMYKKIGKFLRHCEKHGIPIIDNRFNILSE